MSSVAEPDELCAALTTLGMRTRVDLHGQMAIHRPLGEGVASLIASAPMKHLLSDSQCRYLGVTLRQHFEASLGEGCSCQLLQSLLSHVKQSQDRGRLCRWYAHREDSIQ